MKHFKIRNGQQWLLTMNRLSPLSTLVLIYENSMVMFTLHVLSWYVIPRKKLTPLENDIRMIWKESTSFLCSKKLIWLSQGLLIRHSGFFYRRLMYNWNSYHLINLDMKRKYKMSVSHVIKLSRNLTLISCSIQLIW